MLKPGDLALLCTSMTLMYRKPVRERIRVNDFNPVCDLLADDIVLVLDITEFDGLIDMKVLFNNSIGWVFIEEFEKITA